MKSKSIANTNPYLKGKNKEALRKAFIKTVATSTAVKTGESVEELIDLMTKNLEGEDQDYGEPPSTK